MILNPYNEQDIAEIRLIRCVMELTHRILHTRRPEDRTALRARVETLRNELVGMLQDMQIPSEEDVRLHQTAHGPGAMVMPRSLGS